MQEGTRSCLKRASLVRRGVVEGDGREEKDRPGESVIKTVERRERVRTFCPFDANGRVKRKSRLYCRFPSVDPLYRTITYLNSVQPSTSDSNVKARCIKLS